MKVWELALAIWLSALLGAFIVDALMGKELSFDMVAVNLMTSLFSTALVFLVFGDTLTK